MFPGNLELIKWTTTLHQEVASKTSLHIEYRLTTLVSFNRETVVSVIISATLVPFNERKIQVQHSLSYQSSVTYLSLISSG